MISKNDTILVTGCGGMLGEAVYGLFKDKARVVATDIDLNEPWLSYLDVSRPDQVDKTLADIKPNIVIHLAALTDMEYCEQNAAEAMRTNSDGVMNFIPYVEKNLIPFVYISTAGIFDGRKDRYHEGDRPAPKSIYGASKYAGELLARTASKHIVVRAGWMVGGGPNKDKKFINKIVKQLRAGTTDIAAVDDKFGAPCYTHDLAGILLYLLDTESYGLYHGVCDGDGSRYDIAKALIEMVGYDRRGVHVRKVASDFFQRDYFAPRPTSEVLTNDKIKRLNPRLVRDWHVCLKEYVAKHQWGL